MWSHVGLCWANGHPGRQRDKSPRPYISSTPIKCERNSWYSTQKTGLSGLRHIINFIPSRFCWNVSQKSLQSSVLSEALRGLSLITSTISNSTPTRLWKQHALSAIHSETINTFIDSLSVNGAFGVKPSPMQTNSSSCTDNLALALHNFVLATVAI